MKLSLNACSVLFAAISLAAPASALHAGELLLNSGFELDNGNLTKNSNNIGSIPTDWTVTGGKSNLDTGSGKIPAYDGPYSGGSDGSSGGTTIFDGTQSTQTDGGVTLSQSFTIATGGDLGGSFSIGDRDGTGASHPAIFTIAGTNTGNTFSYSFQGTSPVHDEWKTFNFDVGVVPAGTYTVSFDLPDTDNVDAVSFGLGVPEPSTWALLALGTGVMFVGVRRSRPRPA